MGAAYDRLKALTHLKKTAMGKTAYLNQAYIGDVEVVWVSTKVRTSVARITRLSLWASKVACDIREAEGCSQS